VLQRVWSVGAGSLAGTGSLLNPLGIITGIGAVVQNEQIKSRLANLTTMLGQVQMLQFATLATSMVGVGVTAVSTALILKRLAKMSDTLDAVTGRLDRMAAEQTRQPLRAALTDIRTSVERYEELRLRRSADTVAQDIDRTLHGSYNTLADGFRRLEGSPGVTAAELLQMLSALALCGAVQFKVLVHAGELQTAESRARLQLGKLRQLAWDYPEDRLAERLGSEARQVVEGVLGLHLLQASQPDLARTLHDNDVSGPDYIRRIEEEAEAPLLFISVRRE
jgi:hypothetical protein